MAALILLAGAILLLLAGHERASLLVPASAGAMLLGVLAGLILPDLDQRLSWLLDHRDALTHSVLPALAACVRAWLRPLGCGLGLGLGLHLAADCFPEAMTGFATVKLPGAGSIGGWSYAWLAANALAGAALFGWASRAALPRVLLRPAWIAAGLIGLVYLAGVDGGWWALALLGGIGAIVGWLRGRAGVRA